MEQRVVEALMVADCHAGMTEFDAKNEGICI